MNNLKKELLLQLLIEEFRDNYAASAIVEIKQPAKITKARKAKRNRQHNWTVLEKQMLNEYRAMGYSWGQIGKRMNLTGAQCGAMWYWMNRQKNSEQV